MKLNSKARWLGFIQGRWLGFILSAFMVSATFGGADAWARRVILNDMPIGELKNTTLKNCTVYFDETGTIHITAKHYTVSSKTNTPRSSGSQGKRPQIVAAVAGKRPPQGEVNTRDMAPKGDLIAKYFLYAHTRYPGRIQYDADVYINGKWLFRLDDQAEQVVRNISNNLTKGENTINLSFTKNLRGKGKKSSLPSETWELGVGIGKKSEGNIVIVKQLVSTKVSAKRDDNFGFEKNILIN